MPDLEANTVPIAIIGIGCRFAGDATSPETLWEMLKSGQSAWSEIPASRFNLKGWYHPNHENISTTNVGGGHFLKEDLGSFDANFFGFSAETASTMDPQYRMLLEIVYEALENAGLDLDLIEGSNTSVFSGAFFHDYQDGHMRDAENLPRFLMTGNGAAMASNRISHFFDFRGPSMTIDTGCSTTLTALHQACQGLRCRDSDMSIVGGSNLLINPDYFVTISTLGILSKDGRSYSFDNRANGYGRGEGVAAIVLKRLDDAISAGDPIRAVIQGTHINQDGKTETITSPSCHAQSELIRSCYARAGINPSSVQYFEAHGTGTPTGDPIEASAIASVFREGRPCDKPLYIGSVKTNLGHTEPTSGLASVIKVVLSLERGLIPPSINFETPNERLSLDEWNLKVPIQCEKWPAGPGGVRRASVNNFGYGGANAHVIMEDWQQNDPPSMSSNHEDGSCNGDQTFLMQPKLFILSAKDETSCGQVAFNLESYLRSQTLDCRSEARLFNNLAFTLGDRRTRFPWAFVYSASSISELVVALADDNRRAVRSGNRPRLGFVFTGQGAQWYAMGRELLAAYPIFKASILEAEAYLKEFGCRWSLLEELLRDEETSKVFETSFGMPLCAAVQISLVRLLESWGISPTAVCSHSSGEIAAAYTIGALSYRSAMAACYSRCEIASGLNDADGGMMAVGLDAAAVKGYLEHVREGSAKIACINSPSSVTVSGDSSAIEQLHSLFKERNIFARRLRVRTAFHSHHMQPLYEPYLNSMQQIMQVDKSQFRPIIYASPTTGKRIADVVQLSHPKHWAESMVRPVLFMDAFRQMVIDPTNCKADIDIAIEVGPHAALSGPIEDILLAPDLQNSGITYLPSLVRNRDAVCTMQELAGQLLSRGFPVNLNAINFPIGKTKLRVLTDLHPYPWNHQVRHWDEPRVSVCHRSKQFEYHDLLGSRISGTNPFFPTWRHVIRLSDVPWVREHIVQSNVIYPGAGFICMAIEATRQVHQATHENVSGYRLRDVDIMQALLVPEGPGGVEIQLTLNPVSQRAIGLKGWREFKIFSIGEQDKWTEHCTGLINVDLQSTEQTPTHHGIADSGSYYPPHQVCPRLLEPEAVYAALRSNGIHHGKIFRNVQSIEVGNNQAVATFAIGDVESVMPSHYQHTHIIHPTTLDSIFISAYGGLLGAKSKQHVSMIPKKIKSLWVSQSIISRPSHQFKACVQTLHGDSKSFKSDIQVYDAIGDETVRPPVLVIDQFLCQSLGTTYSREEESHMDDICTTVKWAPDISFMDLGLLHDQLRFLVDSKEQEAILQLRRACFHYIRDALDLLTPTDIQELEWHHKKFHTWMKAQIHCGLSSDLSTSSSEWIQDSDEFKIRLFDDVRSSSVNGEAVCRLGTNLVSILTQKISPLELLMEDKLLHKYYGGALKFDRCNIQLTRIAEHLIHKNPRVRVLEIGAGTGGTTRFLLDIIGNGRKGGGRGPFASEYHFTDISSGFFAEAQDHFQEWSEIITYRKLDIESDPEKQGFECNSYDLVVASQVLHATKSMESTMRNVRSLLKPGGKLLFMESTKDQMDMQFVFGLLPGWWLSSDGRDSSPTLSAEMWDKVLVKNGFSGCDLDVHDCESQDVYSFSVILSTAICDEPVIPNFPPIALIRGMCSPYHDEAWINTLKKSVATITHGSLVSVESIDTVDATGKICVFLDDLEESILSHPGQAQFDAIVRLVLRCKGLLWVTCGGAVGCINPRKAVGSGFLRTLRLENPRTRYISLDLDPQNSDFREREASVIVNVLQNTMDSWDINNVGCDFEFADRRGEILVPRLIKDFRRNRFISKGVNDSFSDIQSVPFLDCGETHGRRLKLGVNSPGLLETLTFKEISKFDGALDPEFVEIEPRVFGLNFRDVMVAMGQLNETVMGLECSGVITGLGTNAASHGFSIGDHVIALLDGQYQSRVRVPWTVVCTVSQFDFDMAASIPMAFTTAYISIYDKARLCKGQSILIHAAAGGVGQAAIILSQHLGAEVFVTAGSSEKRVFIASKYRIPEDHVFSSRESTFLPKLMSATGGKGVNVVLNCLSGELLQESFKCLAPFGHFIEIGKVDMESNHYLEMAPFTRVASFSSIDILALVRIGSSIIHDALTTVTRLLEQGLIHPVDPIKMFPLSNIEQAFRQMQAGKQIGKIVLSVTNCTVPCVPLTPSVKLHPDRSYLITGGVGGIGKSIAQWLLNKGGRSLILMSRNATTESSATSFVQKLETAYPGCKIHLVSCDISESSELAITLEKCSRELPPISGVIQAAMVLRDSIIENMNVEDFNAAIRPKVQGTWNLHQHLGKNLDFFIMLSSLAGVIGNPSQSNYTAGGAFQDALATYRVSKGLPAVSLDIGAVRNVGYVGSNKSIHERLERMGYRLLDESEILSAIESAILYPCPQIVFGMNTGESEGHDNILRADARFGALRYSKPVKINSNSTKPTSTSEILSNRLSCVSSLEEASGIILQALIKKLVDIFMIPAEEVIESKSMADFGVDSLIAVELRNMLTVQAGAEVSIFDIMQSTSLTALTRTIASASAYVKVA